MIELEGNFGKKFIDIYGGGAKEIGIEDALATIDQIDDSNNTISQIFDAENIAGKKHLLHAAKLALEAIKNDQSFADSPKIELTCWVAGKRQINKAIKKVGVNKESKKIAFITIGEDSEKVKETEERILESLEIEKDEDALKLNDQGKKRLQNIYSISEEMLEHYSIEEIILENTALLSLEM